VDVQSAAHDARPAWRPSLGPQGTAYRTRMASPWPAARCGRPRSQPCRPTAPSPLPWRCPYAGHPPVPQGRRLSRRRPRWPGLQSRARGPEASYAPTAATLGREPPCAEGSLACVPPPGPGADGRRCRTAVTASPGGAGGSPDGGRPARGSPRRSRRRPQRASTGRVRGPWSLVPRPRRA
jgi:hypothetical protein